MEAITYLPGAGLLQKQQDAPSTFKTGQETDPSPAALCWTSGIFDVVGWCWTPAGPELAQVL